MTIKNITPTELKKLIEHQEDFTLVDCREKDEWDSERIEKAIFLPLSNFNEESKKLTDKNKKVVLQCRGGVRSMNAARMLESKGFTNLYNLEGGIMNWINEGNKVIK